MHDDKEWGRRLAHYRVSNNKRAALELAATVIPLIALYGLMYWAFTVSYWLVLLLSLPTAAMLVRLFAIQHDCGHGAFLSAKTANDYLGRLLGVFTLTPYDDWRREHALHHMSSGNLNRRGLGDIATLTTGEYRARSKIGKLKYWLYRHPFVLFVIGPAWQFLLRHRWPTGKTGNLMPFISTHATNLGIIVFSLLMIWLVGWLEFLAVQLPVTLLAATAGVWLFYVQHQFEDTYWEREESWQREEAALHGSTYYDLPQPLMWLTGNIGIHHVHHISSQIPFHMLPRVISEYPELKQVGRLTIWESIKCIPLTLWDEESRTLISFRKNRQLVSRTASG